MRCQRSIKVWNKQRRQRQRHQSKGPNCKYKKMPISWRRRRYNVKIWIISSNNRISSIIQLTKPKRTSEIRLDSGLQIIMLTRPKHPPTIIPPLLINSHLLLSLPQLPPPQRAPITQLRRLQPHKIKIIIPPTRHLAHLHEMGDRNGKKHQHRILPKSSP